MLYGVGWTQRWEVAAGAAEVVQAEIDRVGRPETSHLAVLDPETGGPANLVVAWQHVAAAIVVGAGRDGSEAGRASAGQYR